MFLKMILFCAFAPLLLLCRILKTKNNLVLEFFIQSKAKYLKWGFKV